MLWVKGVFSLHLSIHGLRKGPGKFLTGVLESPGKVLDFFSSERVGTLLKAFRNISFITQAICWQIFVWTLFGIRRAIWLAKKLVSSDPSEFLMDTSEDPVSRRSPLKSMAVWIIFRFLKCSGNIKQSMLMLLIDRVPKNIFLNICPKCPFRSNVSSKMLNSTRINSAHNLQSRQISVSR